ncbi:MAG: cysteine peptidase family C39 domain-containing protein [Mucilaginibacter sp.]|uniref:cysteine peptidase family C39 domain-containing protein n=1 Tax=Mucilaginibacter sp. TaxID=1882438 RepID=UPI0032655694
MINSNIARVTKLLVDDLKIAITRQSINDELQRHPHPNSMLAISDVLANWGIPNAPYELSVNELTMLPVPFIAYLKSGKFVLISTMSDNEVIVSNEVWHRKLFSIDDFKKVFSGSVLAVEKDEISEESNYRSKRRKEILESIRVPFVIIGTVVVFFRFFNYKQPLR